jgi:hypothetical protein
MCNGVKLTCKSSLFFILVIYNLWCYCMKDLFSSWFNQDTDSVYKMNFTEFTINNGEILTISKDSAIDRLITVEKGGRISINNCKLTINYGGQIINNGIITADSCTLVINGTIDVGSIFDATNSTINVNRSESAPGKINVLTYTYYQGETYKPSGEIKFINCNLNIAGDFDVGKLCVIQIDACEINVKPLGKFDFFGQIIVANKNKIINNGEIIIRNELSLSNNLQLVVNKDCKLIVTGKLNVNDILNVYGKIVVYGTIDVAKGGALNVENGVIIDFEKDSTLDVNGAINVNGTINVNGRFDVNGTIDIAKSGTIYVNGSFTINENVKIIVSGKINVLGGLFYVNMGKIDVLSGGIINVQNSNDNSILGTLDISGVMNILEPTNNNKVTVNVGTNGIINIKEKGTINVYKNGVIDFVEQGKLTNVENNVKSIVSAGGLIYYTGGLQQFNKDTNNSFTVNGTVKEKEVKEKKTCFPFDAIATTSQGKKRCGDLIVGDHVLVDHKGTFEPILFFGHRENEQALFVELLLKNGKSMSASPQHYIFTFNNRNKKIVPIKDVVIGDYVKYNGKRVKVEQISSKQKKGFVSPMTKSCEIIIDGVQASCCTDKYTLVVLKPLVDVVDALGITVPLQVVDPIRNAANLFLTL